MPMRKGTKVLGPSSEARMAAQERRSAAAAARAMRMQGEEERSEAPIARQGAQAARKAGGASRYISENKKGGKIMKHASKAGNAMKRKSADTMGRAMKKYAKGGSIDGCATKGKTKGKMVTMARGGMTGGCK